jgi:hypothetical protein
VSADALGLSAADVSMAGLDRGPESGIALAAHHIDTWMLRRSSCYVRRRALPQQLVNAWAPVALRLAWGDRLHRRAIGWHT